MEGLLTKYWTILRVDPGGEYIAKTLPLARSFLEEIITSEAFFDNVDDDLTLQKNLHSIFVGRASSSSNVVERAKAGLCLRCFISASILKVCKQYSVRFGGRSNAKTLLQSLVSEVLDDDGTTLVLLGDQNRKVNYQLDRYSKLQEMEYQFVTVEVLRTWQPDAKKSLSLANWAYYVIRQNQRFKNVLSEFGFKRLSDWAQLNRARDVQLQGLSDRVKHLVATFHAVYRRDWIQRKNGDSLRPRQCPKPSDEQLTEMLTKLTKLGVVIQSTEALIGELRQTAKFLREDDISRRQGSPFAEPIELKDSETGEIHLRSNLPVLDSEDPEKIDYQEMFSFLQHQLLKALEAGIQQGVQDQLIKLKQSRRKTYASHYVPGIRQIYCEGASQRELQKQFGFKNGAHVSRVLAPEQLINQVRFRTLENLLDTILVRAHQLGFTDIPPDHSYLSNLVHQLEVFLDNEIFLDAFSELRSGKKQILNSLYAEQLRIYLKSEGSEFTQGESASLKRIV